MSHIKHLWDILGPSLRERRVPPPSEYAVVATGPLVEEYDNIPQAHINYLFMSMRRSMYRYSTGRW